MMKLTFKSILSVFVVVSLSIFISCKEDEFINSDPTIEDQSFSLTENSVNGTVVGIVIASDPDLDQELEFTLISGNTNEVFSLSSEGEITVNNSSELDFESNNSFILTVEVKDDFDGKDMAEIVISVVDENETHTLNNEAFTVNENSVAGFLVGTMRFSDPDVDEQLFFTISSGNSNEAFSINNSGEITVNKEEELDFESNEKYELTIDLVDDSNVVVQATCTITILDLNEMHVVENQFFSIEENSSNSTLVGSIIVEDPENNSFSYSIIGGNGSSVFELNSSGEILVVSECDLNYEVANSYSLLISVSDMEFDVESEITIEVTDQDEVLVHDGLVAFYPFNGNSSDESANSNNGNSNGSTLVSDKNGCDNSAYSFDGVDDTIEVDGLVSATSANTTGTLSFWIKVPDVTPSTPSAFLSFGDTNNRNYILAYLWTDGLLRFAGIKNNAESFLVIGNSVEISANTWHHLTYVQDGIQPKIYVDGVMIATSNFTAVDLGLWLSDQPSIDNATIGVLNQNNIIQWYMEGDLDNVRVYNRALTDSEIGNLYDNDN